MNSKGFVLVETLVVTIFTLIIFTMLYTGVVPLIAKYDELSYYDDIDITYDLYNLKKMLLKDASYDNLGSNHYKKFTCNDLTNKAYCQVMFDYLNIKPIDEVIYLDTNYLNELNNDSNISHDVKNYIKYIDSDYLDNNKILILNKNNYISFINYDNC